MTTRIAVPTVVRVEAGALDALGGCVRAAGRDAVLVLASGDLRPDLIGRADRSLADAGVAVAGRVAVTGNEFERATEVFAGLPGRARGVVGLGGGKALDLAKYVAFLARLPYFAVPTSLSNDGFCSPQSSLTVGGRRKSLAAAVPFGVVADTAVCRDAPRELTLSGVGDLMAKLTAVHDWRLAAARGHGPVNDLAALLSDETVSAFLSRPALDEEGVRRLATALLFNGVAMEVCGSSRPASGSEHLISHALDMHSGRPRLHGLQVGVATYLVSRLQDNRTERIAGVFDATGFWDAVAADPFVRAEWADAVRRAPAVKEHFHTILSEPGKVEEAERLLTEDARLARCFGERRS